MGDYDWRLSEKNVWKVERMLLDTQHQPLRMAEARFRRFPQRGIARSRSSIPTASRSSTKGARHVDAHPEQFLVR